MSCEIYTTGSRMTKNALNSNHSSTSTISATFHALQVDVRRVKLKLTNPTMVRLRVPGVNGLASIIKKIFDRNTCHEYIAYRRDIFLCCRTCNGFYRPFCVTNWFLHDLQCCLSNTYYRSSLTELQPYKKQFLWFHMLFTFFYCILG